MPDQAEKERVEECTTECEDGISAAEGIRCVREILVEIVEPGDPFELVTGWRGNTELLAELGLVGDCLEFG